MINRHKISETRNPSKEYISSFERIESRKQTIENKLKIGSKLNIGSIAESGYRNAIYGIIDKKNINNSLYFYLELGTRHFQREFSLTPTLVININGKDYEVDKIDKRYKTKLFDWWNLFNVALILRNEELKKDLYSLLNNCMKESKDPFWRRSMDLILMCNEKKEFQESILSDLKSIVNSGVVEFHGIDGNKLIKSKEGKDIRETMWLPIMELHYLAYKNEEIAFNNLLEEYLIFKKQWILKNKEEDNSNYWVDFPLLACCSYAFDKGLVITVESDYIPSFVYRAKFLDNSI